MALFRTTIATRGSSLLPLLCGGLREDIRYNRLHTMPDSRHRPPGLVGKAVLDEEDGEEGYPTAQLDVLLRRISETNAHGRQNEVRVYIHVTS